MKSTIGIVVLLPVISFLNVTLAAKELKPEGETIFQRNFRRLHKRPPPLQPASQTRASVQFSWIEQKLDNFKESETRTWQMRYLANGEFYQKGAPFFIFIGGEWEISDDVGFLRGGHFYDMAKEHSGYLFYTEHRYYGQSRPTSNLDDENLKYLDVRQALADLAHFIQVMRATIPGASKSKVILAGASYSATMATWFKKLYPQLATGVWASSAPLLAKVNYVEYKEITGQSIRLVGGEACYNRIKNGIAEMEALFANKCGAEVKALLKLCKDFDENNDLDLWTLFSVISNIFAGVVQSYTTEVGEIEHACNKIMEGKTDITGLASYLLMEFGSNTCNDLRYESSLESLLDFNYTSDMIRQWIYQTCNEFGWYPTSDSRNQPFGTKFPLPLYTKICQDSFGKRFTYKFIKKQVAATNKLFGGLKPNVENVYFTHGQLDPWRAAGIQKGKNVAILPLYSHNRDSGSISSSDTAAMRAVKLKIAQLVRQWLKN